jgi:hypothetical protein
LKILSIEESIIDDSRFKLKAQQANGSVQDINCEGKKLNE